MKKESISNSEPIFFCKEFNNSFVPPHTLNSFYSVRRLFFTQHFRMQGKLVSFIGQLPYFNCTSEGRDEFVCRKDFSLKRGMEDVCDKSAPEIKDRPQL